MKFKKRIAFFTAIMMALLTVGCGSKSMSASEDSATMESVYGTDYSENEYCEEPAETADAGVTSGNGLEAQVENGRKLIRTVSLSLQTKEFDSVLNSLKTKTTELGGYVENSSVSGNSYSYTTTRYASYTIRIPADKLNEFVDIVGELGNVTQENESVEDVTLQYVDVESHKKALETEQARLMELLSTAENMEDLLAIESKLSDIRYEIESYESQLRLLDNQIDYSTVHVEIFEVERMTDAGEKGFFEEIKERFGDNLYKVGHGFRNLIIGILGALPILIVCAAVIAVIVVIVKKSIKKITFKKQKKAKENDYEENFKQRLSFVSLVKQSTQKRKTSESNEIFRFLFFSYSLFFFIFFPIAAISSAVYSSTTVFVTCFIFFSFRRRYTNSLKIVYRTETNGMKISIPTIPMRLPPIVTAASTQIDGSPTDPPTTCG